MFRSKSDFYIFLLNLTNNIELNGYTSTGITLLHFQYILLGANGIVAVSIALIELILEFHPMQSQRMQEALHRVHAHQHSKCHPHQNIEHYRHLHKILFTTTIAM